VILHLVTDRHRLAPSSAFAEARALLLEQARHAVAAGVDVIQVRERDLEPRELVPLVEEVVALARSTATRVVVNDRLDVALAAGAGGVHLPTRGIPPAEARRIVPDGFLIGRSVHRIDEVRAAAGSDYLIAGTVWPSLSKPAAAPLLGVGGLSEVVRAADVPVLAIGGVTVDRAHDVLATGAAGIAAIGLFAPERKRTGAEPSLDMIVRRLRAV
jgi:thiamine-phosphate pyrophosphorylase